MDLVRHVEMQRIARDDEIMSNKYFHEPSWESDLKCYVGGGYCVMPLTCSSVAMTMVLMFKGHGDDVNQ